MKYFTHLLASIFLPFAYSAIQSLSVLDRNLQAAYCSTSPDQTLEERFNCADVVLTGTIVKLNHGGRKSKHNSTVAGGTECVKVWTIIKPSNLNLKEFVDRDLQRKVKRIRSKRNAGIKPSAKIRSSRKMAIIGDIEKPNQPILEVYNVQNRRIDGSILQEGDTRVFFLRRRRRPSVKRKRSAVVSVSKLEDEGAKNSRKRRRKRARPSSLLSLEELTPVRISLRVLNELDSLSKRLKT